MRRRVLHQLRRSPASGEDRVSERGGPHDRIGLAAGARADERYGDRPQLRLDAAQPPTSEQ